MCWNFIFPGGIFTETHFKRGAAPVFVRKNPVTLPDRGAVIGFIKKNAVMFIALIAAVATSFLLSIAMITACCIIFIKPEPLEIAEEKISLPPAKTAIYLALFALSIVIVFHVIPYYIGLIVVPLALLFLERKALGKVDYMLLLTFAFFFIFAGNMARIEPVREFFGSLLEKNTLVFSAMSCQFISNVPSAILLSQFTSNYRELLVVVNIGGTGTLIASLASLITFREFTKRQKGQTRRYIIEFSAFNFAFLIILILFNTFVI